MTKDDIIKLAREAGMHDPTVFYPRYKHFANLVAAHKAEVALAEAYRCGYKVGSVAEREACAQVVDDFGDEWMCYSHELSKIIRARTTP